MAEQVDLKAFVEGFVAEAEEHLGGSTGRLLAIEAAAKQGKAEPRAVRELFRSLHTIKGLAGMVGVAPIVELAHELEAILRAADRAGGRVPIEGLDLLAQGLREIQQRVSAVAAGQKAPAAPAKLLSELVAARSGVHEASAGDEAFGLAPEVAQKLNAGDIELVRQALREGHRVVRVDFVPDKEKAAAGVNITQVREALARLGEIIKVQPVTRAGTAAGLAFALLVVTDAPDAQIAAAASTTPAEVVALRELASPAAPALLEQVALPEEAEGQVHRYIRVQVSRLDDAMERMSALVVTRFKMGRALAALTARGADTRELAAILGENSRQLRDLRAAIMQARLVSVAEVMQRLPLVVRGLTRGTHKKVELEVETGRAELDKSVAERLFPALIHLVRNAVDHAIEPEEERLARGKPPVGRVRLQADDAAGGQLTLTVSDDGRGVDREAVARRTGRPAPPTDAELLELICQPGLSTREQASHTSGRGMGMDIVLRTVRRLGGTMSLSTTPGQGTRFTVQVPVSITIVDTFGFCAGDQTFVAPVAMVEEILEIDPARVVHSPGGDLIERRGTAVPLVALSELLGLPGTAGAVSPKALWVQGGGAPIALGVDRMLGQQEVVVRPLEDPLVRVAGVSGATDLGDGRPTLVLDLIALGASLVHGARA